MQYTLGKIPLKIIPLPVTLILAASQNYKKHAKEADKLLDLANKAKASYTTLLTESELKNVEEIFNIYATQYDIEINEANRKLKATKITLSAGIAVSTVSYYISTLIKKPDYSETPLLSRISFNLYDVNAYGLSCVINLPSK